MYELPVCVRDAGLFEENRCRPGEDKDIIVGGFVVGLVGVSSSGSVSTFVHFPAIQAHGIVESWCSEDQGGPYERQFPEEDGLFVGDGPARPGRHHRCTFAE